MSNLETTPEELTCTAEPNDRGRLLEPRDVPLGGPRAMTVRRTLPQRAQSLIGAWCFVDHYGPDDVSDTGGMRVAGHPHTGLQTVSWLFSGEVEHRDTTGAHAYVRPGEVNLMTAGSGIAHSEYSTEATTSLHGVQLWVALPESDRFTAPGFEHYVPEVADVDGAQLRVFLGSLAGHTSPVHTYTPLLGAELTLPAGLELRLDVDPAHEHGVLVDQGTVETSAVTATDGQLVHRPVGATELTLHAHTDARVLLLGGEPLGEQVVMWWNFVGRSHDEVAGFRAEWEAARAGGPPARFGAFPQEWEGKTIPAPELPNVRLRPRT
ncbi:pirin [Saccharomonospora sp. CUA-673]|uniref:pirin family protein n=1 Tax=Saccharomonospora sp. CUA-673 TaxID=1904969 RepID=UPI00095B592F|nr:pirin family protein [Saccharomonospora sp. CUA-673]OLT45358.1 pirin [Saccharomonospora sp. CUA-673]